MFTILLIALADKETKSSISCVTNVVGGLQEHRTYMAGVTAVSSNRYYCFSQYIKLDSRTCHPAGVVDSELLNQSFSGIAKMHK